MPTDPSSAPDRGPAFWRGLAESYGAPVHAAEEFPRGADRGPAAMNRRSLLQLLGASMALSGIGGLVGCAAPGDQPLVPYARQPPELTPGVPRFFATAMAEDGYASGLLVETHEGRPTKIEGNPDHPASRGACGLIAQASILQLYDPDRAATIREGTLPRTWEDVRVACAPLRARGGEGVSILLEPTSSPLVAARLARLREVMPAVRIHVHDALQGGAQAAALALYGERLVPRLDLTQARVIVSLDSDFLVSGPDNLMHAAAFAAGRRARAPGQEMNRLYVAESSPTCTGSTADHRLRLGDAQIVVAAAVLLDVVMTGRPDVPPLPLTTLLASPLEPAQLRWLQGAAADLLRNRGACVVVAGHRQPAAVHALVHALNEMLGNLGTTVGHATDPLLADHDDLAALCAALDAGTVDTLVLLDGNPLATVGADLDLPARFAKARQRIGLGLYEHETARTCDWFIPEAHYLEAWGALRAYDGTISLQQPMIRPLTGGRTAAELLAALSGDSGDARALLMAEWATGLKPAGDTGDPQPSFEAALRLGIVAGSAWPARPASCSWPALTGLIQQAALPEDVPWEVSLRPDAKIRDGRYANNPWLLELPDPITKQTWGNAALLAPGAAEHLGVVDGEVIELTLAGRRMEIPVLILPGQADRTVTIALGYGRSGAERTAAGVGVDAFPMRTVATPWFAAGLAIRSTGRQEALAVTQEHWRLDDRPIVRERTWEEFKEQPVPPPTPPQSSLREDAPQAGRQWAMVVDLTACIGCSACVVACQAENNIPVVGRDNVLLGREMHWMRVDRYYRGSATAPSVIAQPMTCQHCEKAPCEYVCPTYATTHSPDGLNEMTYNRCVGTRFCSNNCPYKVRRFNWYNFNDNAAPVTILARNPDVTVRARGVMEKCTACVQRIREAEIGAALADEPQRPLAVRTACQQTCPTSAIVFGDINDPESAVVAARNHPLAYAVLEETGAAPRTRYLARLTNPNPDLA